MTTSLMPDVTVNGVAIEAALIAAEAQNHPAPPGKPGLAWRAAARALALREAMLQEARARGLTAQAQEVAPGQIETDDEALIRALLDQEITPQPVDDAALRALYDAQPDRHRAPPLWEASHILIAAPASDDDAATAARAKARTRAEALAEHLRRAPGDLPQLARTQSECSSRASGGMLGQIGPGDTLPAFEAALRALQPGQITPRPVETRHGWHLIRLDAAAQGDVLPFDAVLPRLREAAQKAAWVRAAKAWTAQVFARANITGIDPPQT